MPTGNGVGLFAVGAALMAVAPGRIGLTLLRAAPRVAAAPVTAYR